MTTPALADVLYLWWLGEPLAPQLVGVLRWVRRAQHQHAGVSLRYASSWLAHGFADDAQGLPSQRPQRSWRAREAPLSQVWYS